jgi:hypothetical protein
MLTIRGIEMIPPPPPVMPPNRPARTPIKKLMRDIQLWMKGEG